jgi:hypothetical protein
VLNEYYRHPCQTEKKMSNVRSVNELAEPRDHRRAPCLYALISFFAIVAASLISAAPAYAQSVETWKLIKREYPVLPHAIVDITTGRNAGSFIKVRRTERRNEVVYIGRNVVRGHEECLWRSGFVWDDQLPETIVTGREILVQLQSRFDIHHGQGCGMGRIGVTYGNRAEPLRDRASNVVRVREGLADPDPGGVAPPAATEIFRVRARPDLPQNDMFTVAIHISDGGVTDEVVALYVYEKVAAGSTSGDRERAQAAAGTIVRLQSLNYPGLFIRHRNFLGELTRIATDLDRKDASFRLVPGLADRNLVSFESVNYPGYYLRHQGFRIKLMRGPGDDLFRKDATFRRVPGLANGSMVSFESLNYPGYYIRHRDFHLYLERGNTELFRKDATFRFSAFGG